MTATSDLCVVTRRERRELRRLSLRESVDRDEKKAGVTWEGGREGRKETREERGGREEGERKEGGREGGREEEGRKQGRRECNYISNAERCVH